MLNNSFTNGTLSPPLYTNPALDASLIVLSVFILVINGLVIFLFFSREYLQTKTNSILVSLSVSDLTVGLVGIPLYLACNWVGSANQICFASAATYRLQAVSEMAHIFMATIERYIYVMFPMKYIRIVTAPRILKLMGGVWCFSLFVTFIQVAWNDPNDFFYNFTENPTRRLCAIVYNCFTCVVCFLIPLIIMVVSYSRMFDVIHRQIKEIHQNYPRGAAGSSQRTPIATEARAVSIFALMLSVFTLAWSSWYVIGVGVYFVHFYEAVPGPLMEFLHFFRFAVAFINPILYTFLKRDFSRALKSLFNREGLRRDFVASTHLRSRGFASHSMQTRFSNSYGDDNPITANGNAT